MDDKLNQLEALIKEKERTHLCIQKFDHLDFEVFNKQKWVEIEHSHIDDVVVHWPAGRTNHGIAQYVEDLKSFYIATPNQYIQPTGKSLKLQMASIGKWNSENRIVEEWSFFDNDAYLKQLGIRT